MGKGFFKVPVAKNEAVLSYAPGSTERKNVLSDTRQCTNQRLKYRYILMANT